MFSPNYWAAKSINALAEGGYISGSGGGAFEPDGLITYEQACKILVTAAGYKEYAGMSAGDSMSGYIRTAQRIGVFALGIEDIQLFRRVCRAARKHSAAEQHGATEQCGAKQRKFPLHENPSRFQK